MYWLKMYMKCIELLFRVEIHVVKLFTNDVVLQIRNILSFSAIGNVFVRPLAKCKTVWTRMVLITTCNSH